VNAVLFVSSINDQNVIVGESQGAAIIATPTGVFPHVQLSDSNWTFGSHAVGESSGLGRVFLSNTGPADLHIPTMYVGTVGQLGQGGSSFSITPSSCAVGEHFQEKTIPPGGSCFVEFVFTPKQPGWQTGTIYIPNDAPDAPTAIQVGGTGIGDCAITGCLSTLQLSNTSWIFAAHRVGETSGSGVIYAYNPGPGIVTFQNTQIVGQGDLLDFNLTGNTCGAKLQPNTTCALTFNFAPLTPGERTALLYLNDNSANGPFEIQLLGYAH
jgi:hypothetical protein